MADVEALYTELDDASDDMLRTQGAYIAATARRAAAVRGLRAVGVRPAEIGRRLGVSSSRVGQIAEIRERT